MAWISGNRYLGTDDMQNNAIEANAYLLSKGWSPEAIAGMLGNMQTESTINPGIWESLKVDYSRGYGLVQWTPATKYIDWAGANYADGNRQLDRIIYEAENGLQWFANPNAPIVEPPISLKQFTVSRDSPTVLANYFLWYYEHPKYTIQPNRAVQAEQWYEFLGGSA